MARGLMLVKCRRPARRRRTVKVAGRAFEAWSARQGSRRRVGKAWTALHGSGRKWAGAGGHQAAWAASRHWKDAALGRGCKPQTHARRPFSQCTPVGPQVAGHRPSWRPSCALTAMQGLTLLHFDRRAGFDQRLPGQLQGPPGVDVQRPLAHGEAQAKEHRQHWRYRQCGQYGRQYRQYRQYGASQAVQGGRQALQHASCATLLGRSRQRLLGERAKRARESWGAAERPLQLFHLEPLSHRPARQLLDFTPCALTGPTAP